VGATLWRRVVPISPWRK